MNNSLFTDYYEIVMGHTNFESGETEKKEYFDIFFRSNVLNGGYAISGGLDNIIDFINNFNITDKHIDYLRTFNKFSEKYLTYLKNLKFSGDLYSVPDGTPIFPNEPILTVRANAIEAKYIETALLTNFNHGTLVTTAAKRIVEAANGKSIIEFGARRGRSISGAVEASKYAYVAGCIGTSNVESGMIYGVPVMGTMAHSMVCESDSEYEAFMKYAKYNPNDCILLVDTYDTLNVGIPNAIRIAKEYLEPNGYRLKGIRIDSGDLAYLSKEARKILDNAGLSDTKITLSNSLNEDKIKALIDEGAIFDSLGVGDNISAANDRLGGVYKLIAIEKNDNIIPKIKLSDDSIKTITPGYKKLYRFYDKESGYAIGDLVTLSNEEKPKDVYTLINPLDEWKKKTITNFIVRDMLVPIYKNGKQVYELPNIHERRNYCIEEFKTIYPEIKRNNNPHEYYVDLSKKLLELKKQMIHDSVKIKTKELK